MKTAILILLLALSSLAQTTLTTVYDTIYDGSGQRVTGSCSYRLTSGRATGTSGSPVIGESVNVRFVNGAFSASLVPTDTMSPGGQSYTISCTGSRGWHQSGYWIVPTSLASLKWADIWTPTVPSAGVYVPLSSLSRSGATVNQALCWSGSEWGPGNCGGSGGSGLSGGPYTWGSLLAGGMTWGSLLGN